MKKFKLFLPLILAVILPYSMAKVITTSYAYTLTPPVTPPVVNSFITVVKPNGGEWLMNGNTYQITWKSSSDIKTVNIAYSNGPFMKNLATGYSGNSYNWKLSGLAATKNAKIIISATGVGGSIVTDSSDKTFTVLTPKQINPIIVQPRNYTNF